MLSVFGEFADRLRDGFVSHQDVVNCEHPQHHDVAGSNLMQDEKQINRQSKHDPVSHAQTALKLEALVSMQHS
jgi:hypothetical protein